ncbi:unnamed protein product [Blepharisma stoltei]|uniref:GAR domain-containing protein n=1 Tax=Blepharisma stoltei TaxID=1481888 RepID=A0AAU9JDC1_9CILI|nr:unnamed protein product [Blepharisma stoltei]
MNPSDRLTPMKSKSSSKRILSSEDPFSFDRKLNFSSESKQSRKETKLKLSTSCEENNSLENISLSNDQNLKILKETQIVILEIAQALNPKSKYSLKLSPQELALDILNLSSRKGKANSQEADHLRSLLLGLNEKLKAFQLIELRLEEFRSQALESLEERENLERAIEETSFDIEHKRKQQDEFLTKIRGERDKNAKALLELQTKFKEKCKIEEKLINENEILKTEIGKLKAEAQNFENMQDMIGKLKERIQVEENKRKELRELYKDSINEFDNKSKEYDREINKIKTDNADLLKDLNNLKIERHGLISQNENKENQILNLQSEKQKFFAEINGLKDQAAKAKQMEDLAKKFQGECASLSSKLKDMAEKHSSSYQELTKQKNEILAKNKTLCSENDSLKEKIQNQDSLLQQSENGLKELSSHFLEVEQQLVLQNDTNSLKEEVKKVHNSANSVINKLSNDIETMGLSYLKNAENNLVQQRALKEMNSIINDNEAEIEALKDVITELRKNIPVYIPVKNDPIDAAMADYVNTRDRPLDIPFIREDEGLYSYGTKRVFVKLENGKLIIRVGGGFMLIDKFLEIYTIQEIEKFENRKKAEANEKRRSLMGKFASSIINEKSSGRTSLSPRKATKILQEALGNGNSKFATCFAVQRRSNSSRSLIQTAREPESPIKRAGTKKGTFLDNIQRSP